MRHEQNYNDRNYRDRERYNQDRNRRPREQQNTASRWGEPDPRMGPHEDEWRRHDADYNRQQNEYRNDWRPFNQPENRQFRHEERGYGTYRNERPDWNRNEDHSSRNQHANDRWTQDEHMPHQQYHHPRHASERFYREQRRRNW